MNARKLLLITILLAGVVLTAMLCLISLPLPSFGPAAIVLLGFVLMFAGASGNFYLNTIDRSIKRKRGSLLLAANILGIGLFLWGMLMGNSHLLLGSYPFFVFSAGISLSVHRLARRSFWGREGQRAASEQKPSVSPSVHEEFLPYERGYQAQQHPPTSLSQEETQMPELSPWQIEHEQPLVAYPEMPPMQQE